MTKIDKDKEKLLSELMALKQENAVLKGRLEKEIRILDKPIDAFNKNEMTLLSIASSFIPGYIAYVNSDTLKYEFVNDAYVKSFGIPREKIIGSTVKEIIGEPNYQFALKYINEAKLGKSTSYENLFDLAYGKQWLQVNFTPVFNESGRVISIVVFNFDITQRKLAENEVKYAEERFRMLFENVHDGIDIFSEDPDLSKRKLIECNERFANMTGRSREELLKLGSIEGLYKNLDENSNNNRLESLKKGTSFQGTFSWIRPDGRENIIEYRGTPITWGGNLYTIGIDRDITENKKNEEALEKERSLLRTLIDYLPSAVFIKDEKYRKLLVNPIHSQCVAQQLIKLGLKPQEEIIGKTDFEIYPKKLAELYLQDDQKVIRDGITILNKEEPGIGPNGENSWVLVSKIPLKDKNGSIKGMLGITTDITNQKWTEEALRENEKKFRAAFENAPMGMSMTLPNGQYLAVNPVLCKMFGYSEEELLAGTINRITHPDDIERGNQWIRKMISGDRSEPEFEKRYIHKDGHIVWGLVRAEWIKDNTGAVKMSVAHIIDITERKRTEEALKKSEALYRDLVETSQDLIWQCDAHGKYTYLNHAWEEVFGYKIEEMIGRRFSDFQTSYYATRDLKEFAPLLTSNILKGYETVHIGKTGNEIHLVFNAIFLRDEHGKILGSRGTAYDISKRKKDEEVIINANSELKRINSVKDKFFSIIAHDLKSPFQGLVGMTGMMAEDIYSFSQAELSDFSVKMHESVKNLLKLLTNLLDWARMQQGAISYDPVNLILAKVVLRNINLISKSGEQKGIELILNVPDNQKVFADEEMINSILGNLLSNAMKFTSRGGNITISSKESENNMVEIAVQDTGIGMSESLAEKLFKMEERVGRLGTEGEESTGLGLLLCKEFVERHGGKIWAITKENEGSTFYFTLPSNNTNANSLGDS